MANFVLSLHAAPSDTDCCLSLLNFANTCLETGHRIDAIFLYQDAVWHASEKFSLPSDEIQLNEKWLHMSKQYQIPLLLCITAAEKRGLDIEHTQPFTVAGLAELAMTVAKTDRWVQFR